MTAPSLARLKSLSRHSLARAGRTETLLGVLGVLFGLFVWRRLFVGDRLPLDGNVARLFYPAWVVGQRLFRDGAVLWDPYRNLGQPFLADPQNQALYPFRLLASFLPYAAYVRAFVVFHVALAAVFAYRLVRPGRDPIAAAASALVLAFNGFWLCRVTLASHFASAAWLPALLWALDRRRARWLGAFLALQWMAGFPPFTIVSLICLALWATLGERPADAFTTLAKGALVGGGLSAIQGLPFLALLRRSERGLFTGAGATQFSVAPAHLAAGLLLPAPLADLLPGDGVSDPAVVGFFIGPAAIALGLWGARGRDARRFWAIAALGAVLALGRYNPLYRLIPLITIFRFPANWLLLVPAGLAVPVAAGVHRLSPRARIVVLALLALDLGLFAGPARSAWAPARFIEKGPAVLGAAGASDGHRLDVASDISGDVHRWTMSSQRDWDALVRSMAPSLGVAAGWRETESYTVLGARDTLSFLERLHAEKPGSRLDRLADVSAVVVRHGGGAGTPAPDDIQAIRLSNAPGRAFLVDGTPVDVAPNAPPVRVVRDVAGQFEATASGPGWLVFSEAACPGWGVRVDGKNQRLLRVDGLLMAVDLPPGAHAVRFAYQPLSFLIGGALSVLTALAAIATLSRARRGGR